MSSDFQCSRCRRPIDPDAPDTVQETVTLDAGDASSTFNKVLEVPGGKLWHKRCPR